MKFAKGCIGPSGLEDFFNIDFVHKKHLMIVYCIMQLRDGVCVCPVGFLRCLQPVAVSREDPDSRKNTIIAINNRARSEGRWPQVRIYPCLAKLLFYRYS